MTCPACGNENDEEVRFCGRCGALQEGAKVPKAAVRSRARTVFQGSGSSSAPAPAGARPPISGEEATVPAMAPAPAARPAGAVIPSAAGPARAAQAPTQMPMPTTQGAPVRPAVAAAPAGAARPAVAPAGSASAPAARPVGAPGVASAGSASTRPAGAPAPSAVARPESVPAAVVAPRPAAAPAARAPAAAPGRAASTGTIDQLPPVPVDKDLTGTTLNHRYLIKQRLGEGGFGAVYEAEQVQMGRECALKVLHARMARDPLVIGRFRREAKAASVLKDGHTVQIYDFDESEDGVLYLAMELLKGRSLHEEIQGGPLGSTRTVHILDGISSSLGEAHANGIVHRDIKSENIYLEPRPGDPDYVKVLDFGIAKIVSGEGGLRGPALTAAGQTLGTVEYMSPEQLTGQELDGRSDIYALGVLAYEMLTGALPFTVRTTAEMITAHLKTVPLPPSVHSPDLGIPPEVDAIVLRCLEKKREKRFAGTAELQAELKRVTARLAEGPPAKAERANAITDPGRVPPPALVRTAKAGGMSTATLLLIAGIAVAVLGLLAAALWWSSAARADEPPPPAARLVPASLSAIVAVDVQQLRAAGPASAVSQLVEAARPTLKTIGADPARIGQVALGVDISELSGDDKRAAALVLDLPLDPARFETALKPEAPLSTGSYQGQKLREGGSLSYAILPGDRLVMGEQVRVERLIDLARGSGKPLVDVGAASLLAKLGASGGRGPALFGWMKITERAKSELRKQAPGADRLDEAALALSTTPSGADVKVLGRASSKEGAQAAARDTRDALAQASRNSTVALLGLKALVDATRVDVEDRLVQVSLHLSRDQYADVMTRVVGLVMAAQQSAAEDSARAPSSVSSPEPGAGAGHGQGKVRKPGKGRPKREPHEE